MNSDAKSHPTRKKLLIVAFHHPEYSVLYGIAMARYFDVTVVVDGAKFEFEYDGRSLPDLSKIRLVKVAYQSASNLLAILKTIAAVRPDITHIQEAVGFRRGFFSACAASVAKLFGRVILTAHDPLPHTGRDADEAKRASFFRDFVRRRSDFILVHGDSCVQDYLAFNRGAKNLIVSEHGVILQPDRLEPRKASRFTLLFFGRMEAYKGIDTLHSAASLLRDRGVDFKLILAGKGPELDRLKGDFDRMEQCEVHNRFIPASEVITLMAEADCVVLPYSSATRSGVVAGAFANGRFVIASDIPGLNDLVQHDRNGLLVPAGDATALADAIQRVSEHPEERDRLASGALDTAAGQLNWDVIADDLKTKFPA